MPWGKGGAHTPLMKVAYGPTPAPGIATFGILDVTVHAFAAALQGMAEIGMGETLTPPIT